MNRVIGGLIAAIVAVAFFFAVGLAIWDDGARLARRLEAMETCIIDRLGDEVFCSYWAKRESRK